ncbi:Oma1p [Sugiyamaella lignohabitans]|uniref:Oma1p n=1 Tax=Sugiyamaella lignohabitans TaxID=796027 RepID=A0A167FVT9_9ASCO|nr:Oma1p [Sugiyamaella lignohabitans]ANB15763.1 Oma1p [Sugiyamaella lignohabitans]
MFSKQFAKLRTGFSAQKLYTPTVRTDGIFRFFVARAAKPIVTRPSSILHSARSYATYRSFDNSSPLLSLKSGNRTKQIQWVGAATIVIGIFYISNLEEAPYSHRSRFMIVSPKLEAFVGSQGYEETLAQYRPYLLPENHPDVKRVKKVMKRIINVSNLEHLDWKVHVINDPKSPPNAFVLPGGKVFVFSSILPICKDEDGLATVLSHETAHQVARHTAEHLSKAPIYIILGLILYTITGSSQLNQLLISGLLKLPASREMEREADYIGLMMMGKACFNPGEAVHLWERMTEFEKAITSGRLHSSPGGMVPEFLSTHPSSQNRIQFIRSALPEAEQLKDQAGCYNYSGLVPTFMERSRW